MVALWHPDLPQRIFRSPAAPQVVLGANRWTSPTDTGGEDARRRSTARRDRWRVQMPFTENERLLFWWFFNEELASGVYEFWFPGQPIDAPLGDEAGALLLTEDDEEILVEDWWLMQFDRRVEDPATFDRRGIDWIGALSLTRVL